LWFFENERIPSNTYTEMSFNKKTLRFHSINLYNYGTYYCFGWDVIRLRYFLAESSMIVYGKL